MQRPKRNTEKHGVPTPDTSPVDPMVEFRLNKNFSWIQHELDKMPVHKDPDPNPAVTHQRSVLWEWNELLRHTIQDIQTDTLVLLYDLKHTSQAPVEKPGSLFVPIVPGQHPKKVCETLDQAQAELFRYADSQGLHKPVRPMDDPDVQFVMRWQQDALPTGNYRWPLNDHFRKADGTVDKHRMEEAENAATWYHIMSQCIIHELPVEYLEKM